MILYDGLLQQLKARGMSRTALARELGISSRTMAKLGRGEKISAYVIGRIADYLGSPADTLYRVVSDNALLQTLRDEKSSRLPGGIYHELQVRMTYNSNHIEGSRLSEEQTRMIFETATIDAGDGIPVDDVIEAVNHFRAIDCVIDAAEEPLSEELIKRLHGILKRGTRDAELAWFAVGDYKKRPNVVGGRETAPPKEVPARMRSLIAAYEARPAIGLDDIIRFHVEFERIHPFQDGNGRVGRLITLKECLRHNVVPFLIEDAKKAFYYRGLAEWDREPGYLQDTCLDGQDTFRSLMRQLGLEGEQ